MQSARRFVAKNHALKTLIAAAYNLTPRAISGGPTWVDSDHYDILAQNRPAKFGPTWMSKCRCLRKLIAPDRFKLTFHSREPKEFSIYALTVAKNGSKLKETTFSPDASPEGPPPLIFNVTLPVVRLPGRFATVADLASVLQRGALDRPVVDKTGLSGRFDFDLEFTPDETQFDGAFGRIADDPANRRGLFAAMQEQLGLRLEGTIGPIEALVIDHVERPSAN